MLLTRAQSGVFLQDIRWNHFKVLLLEHHCILAGVDVQQDGRGENDDDDDDDDDGDDDREIH